MIEYEYIADMGSMKIMFNGGSCFFSNDYGDGAFKTFVLEGLDKEPNETDTLKFIGHFTSIKEAYLMYSDCSINKKDILHTFKKGRYFVYLDTKETAFYIHKVDEDIHS